MKKLLLLWSIAYYGIDLHAQNVGIGTNSPTANLHISPNSSTYALKIDQGINGDGITCYVNTSSNLKTLFSVAGNNGGVYILGNGNMGIGTSTPSHKLDVSSAGTPAATVVSTLPNQDVTALSCFANNTAGFGTGVFGRGGNVGVEGVAVTIGLYTRIGVEASGGYGVLNYGVKCDASQGEKAYGIYSTVSGGTVASWAGYFSGSVYTTGSYQPSDRRLKKNIEPLNGALALLTKLSPAKYEYDTESFSSLKLPAGTQYGLIADEVKSLLPALVRRAVEPARYENNDEKKGKLLNEEVEFDAVNYTALIPLMIGAIKEQQKTIEELKMQLVKLNAGNQ
jgi:hypothetical protein